MGLGSHKLLDFLSLSLNLPLEFHPHSAFSTKYTKTMKDLLNVRKHIAIMATVAGSPARVKEGELEESQCYVILALNNALFLNNRLYKSDFNEDYFQQ